MDFLGDLAVGHPLQQVSSGQERESSHSWSGLGTGDPSMACDCTESTLCLKQQALPGRTDGLSQQTEPEQSQPWRDGDGPARHEGETQKRHSQQWLRCKFTHLKEASR